MRQGLRGRALFVGFSMLLMNGYAHAVETAMFPNAKGEMVRVPVAHTYAECMRNGTTLGYPKETSHGWCTQHCDGKICQ